MDRRFRQPDARDGGREPTLLHTRSDPPSVTGIPAGPMAGGAPVEDAVGALALVGGGGDLGVHGAGRPIWERSRATGILALARVPYRLQTRGGYRCGLRLYGADRRSGALESLLATDVDVHEIAAGIRREMGRRFAGPLVLLSFAGLSLAWNCFNAGAGQSGFALALVALMLPVDACCLFWTGLFQGLAARGPVVGLATCSFEIVLLPWAWFFIGSLVFVRSSVPELLLLWLIPALVNHAWFVTNAKTHLFRHFRTLALKPFGEKNPAIESDWSPINWDDSPTSIPLQAPGP